MIDQDDIRARVSKRFKDLGLPLTGKWLLDHGIGQTTIRNFVEGPTQSLTVDTVAKLAGPLKTTEHWLLFGEREGINEATLVEMAEHAASEIQPGLSIAQIRSAVASALREQLELHLSVGTSLKTEDEELDPDTSAQSRAPTTGSEQEESRKP